MFDVVFLKRVEKTVIAVIGCGRIAQGARFPAFVEMENIRNKVDKKRQPLVHGCPKK